MIRIQECLCILLRISAILPEAISDGGLTPTTDTDLLLATYRGGSHLTSDILNLNYERGISIELMRFFFY